MAEPLLEPFQVPAGPAEGPPRFFHPHEVEEPLGDHRHAPEFDQPPETDRPVGRVLFVVTVESDRKVARADFPNEGSQPSF